MKGAKFERKGLDEALAYVRSGDTFLVWKLDRLGRSLKHLFSYPSHRSPVYLQYMTLRIRLCRLQVVKKRAH